MILEEMDLSEQELWQIKNAVLDGESEVFIRGIAYQIQTTTVVYHRTYIDLVTSPNVRFRVGEIKVP